MGSEGLSHSRLERLHKALQGYIEGKEMPGMVGVVSRGDDIHFETLGSLAFGASAPMKRDTIFRIASLTKLVTAAAAMILAEECKLRFDDSIEAWIPELANRRVLTSISAALDDTVPAKRAITVRDLLTFRMGFGSVMAMPDTYPIQKAIRELEIGGDGPPRPTRSPSTELWLQSLGSLPLMAQPGERWMYHVSCDVLGVLIGRVSGQSLGAFMRERIFDPLGMRDSSFVVPAQKLSRFATSYQLNRGEGRLETYDGVENSDWGAEPPFESGGGGLVSTLDDYFTFCKMMLNHGKHGRDQILSRASVELMTSDQLSAEQRQDAGIFFGDFSSWGFGMAVDIQRREIYHSPGRYGWTGGLGTTAYVDPANDAIGILFTQRMMDSPEPPKFFSDFWTLAYSAFH
ncbi:MAG TPA: serine hydrolase domain-containing protein [Fimbriimonas sp.]|nr:serine hydrolase domain-containing protein [Fimbriimonas sp.]